jgi:predicted dehydrogenase
MNIAVIGLGSMGKRRIRLLKKHFSSHEIVGIEGNYDRALYSEKEYGIKTFSDLSSTIKSLELHCAFVCTPPITHSEIITECLNHNIHVFTELNLIKQGYEKNISLAKEQGKVLFLSSTALYREEMKYVIEKVHQTKKNLCYCYHVGQYLPDWHPWESYQSSFFSRKETNGCREILAIELPWILKAFGQVRSLNVITNKVTELNIGFHDYYNIQLMHENGAMGNLIVDVVSREAVRKLEVFGEDIYLEWQGKPDSLREKNLETAQMLPISLYSEIDKIEGYSSTIIENQYLDEMRSFFRILEGKERPVYDFMDDLYTLNLIDTIEGI